MVLAWVYLCALYVASVLPTQKQYKILRFCSDILNDAMKNGFVHGDIKMDNLAVQNVALSLSMAMIVLDDEYHTEGTMSLRETSMDWVSSFGIALGTTEYWSATG